MWRQTGVLPGSRATDGNEGGPAGDAPPASGYIVTRDGEEVDRLTATSFRDDPRTGSASDEVTVDYQVQAVDEAGNRSEPVEISVTLPPAPSRLPVYLGIAALVLGGLAAAYRVFRHALLDRRMATGPAPVPEEPELTAVGPGSREG